MRIVELDSSPLGHVEYMNAAPRGGVESAALPIVRAHVDSLPLDVQALYVAGDLQGIVNSWEIGGEPRLLGEELADRAWQLADQHQLPAPNASAAILAGDLYSVPTANKRGATGDVRSVWDAFRDSFAWVAGVSGNHDLFGSAREKLRFEQQDGLHLLDGEVRSIGGILVAGVGYIVGNPQKLGRREESDFLDRVRRVLKARPDVLILHEGPNGDRSQRGNAAIRALLVQHPPTLVLCGHSHWEFPLCELENGTQVLNVDGRLVVLSKVEANSDGTAV